MPKKYHIDVEETPSRYPTIGRSGIVDWGEGCLKCPVCVKQTCIYDVYRKRSFSTEIMADTIDELCKNCMRCVQGCPQRLIHKTLNPEWEALGDDVYTPEIITINWRQAETGKIPVSGAGYGGAFSGPGFDSMWTDMSEIVRPTRDGIHGREYISTVVDIGRQSSRLEFDDTGKLLTPRLPFVRIPIPVIFDILPFGDFSPHVWRAMALAASRLGTLMVVPEHELNGLSGLGANLIPFLETDRLGADRLGSYALVEIPDGREVRDRTVSLKESRPDLIVSIRVPAQTGSTRRAIELAGSGADVIHVVADERGHVIGSDGSQHLKDAIRSIHTALLSGSLRDEVTLIASGGIAMAEHVTKACLCGANLVGVDIPLLIALECRVCRNCLDGGECPVDIAGIEAGWGTQRMVNLMGAWHNQLLEMMGAMGIREARRLRGEQGRLMFIEDLEADTFGRIFSERGS